MASLPLAFVIIVGSSLVIAHVTKNHLIAIHTQILAIMMIPALIQWTIGGFFDSGIVLARAVLGPLGALMFFSPRKSTPWFLLYLVILSITVGSDGYFSEHALDVSENVQRLFFAMNLGASSLVVFIFAGYFVGTAIKERSNANRLLLNVLPAQIAEILKESDDTIARHYDSVSVLFADVVNQRGCLQTSNRQRWWIGLTRFSRFSTNWWIDTVLRSSGPWGTATGLVPAYQPLETTIPRLS